MPSKISAVTVEYMYGDDSTMNTTVERVGHDDCVYIAQGTDSTEIKDVEHWLLIRNEIDKLYGVSE